VREIPYEMAEAADGLDRVDGVSAESLDHAAKLRRYVVRRYVVRKGGRRNPADRLLMTYNVAS